MRLATINQVHSHLYRLNLGEGQIRNQAIRMAAHEYSSLPHPRIVAGSEMVKAAAGEIPTAEQITLGADPALLANRPPIPGTVVCAADDSLGIIYQENVDFAIDYLQGTITRIAAGAIPDNAEVTVWSLSYRTYRNGTDYTIDYDRGRVRRLDSGSIEDGQELLVDYSLGDTQFTDAEIEQCLSEAEAEIGKLVDPVFVDSADPALSSAATFLTLALLCRDSAAIAAGSGATSATAVPWLTLAASYRETAVRLLSWFRRGLPGLKPPQLA